MVSDMHGIGSAIIKYRGLFDMQELMKRINDWLVDDFYTVWEDTYKHKVPDPRGAWEEITFKSWKRITEYVKYWIRIEFRTWDQKEVEVVREGVKKQAVQARIEIILRPTVEFDWQNRFKGNRFMQGLQDFYHKYIIKRDMQDYHEDALYYRTYKLHRDIKEFLDMESKTNAYEGVW
jgi:hypothetical protein